MDVPADAWYRNDVAAIYQTGGFNGTTSTTFAPWHILESVDKKYARIKALQIVVDTLEKALD